MATNSLQLIVPVRSNTGLRCGHLSCHKKTSHTCSSYAYSKQGGRNPVNQDAWFSLPEKGVFAVCDGMGGHKSGDVASNLAITTLSKYLLSIQLPIMVQDIRMAIGMANRAVYERARENHAHRDMGTTITLAWLNNDNITLFHAGDSRAYRVRDYTLSQLTRDHVENNLSESDETAKKGRLLRALGVKPQLDLDEIIAEWRYDDELILLTDGISDVLHQFEIANIMVEHTRAKEERVLKLVRMAENRMGSDDKTILHVSMNQ